MVDATDRLRVEDCRNELKGLLLEEVMFAFPRKHCSVDNWAFKRLAGASLLVFLNKTDVSGCMSEEEVKRALELDRILTHRWVIVPCSAMTGKNLDKGLDWVVQDARDRLFLY